MDLKLLPQLFDFWEIGFVHKITRTSLAEQIAKLGNNHSRQIKRTVRTLCVVVLFWSNIEIEYGFVNVLFALVVMIDRNYVSGECSNGLGGIDKWLMINGVMV